MNPQPIYQSQEGRPNNSTYIETDACCSFATVNAIASQILKITGVDPNLSPRYVAKLSNTGYPGENPPPNYYGNTVQNVYNAIKTYGLVSNDLWPTTITSDAEFYAPIPQDVIEQGRLWLKKWALGELLSVSPGKVSVAPLITEIVIGSPTDDPATGTPHMVCQLTPTTYLDSIWGEAPVKSFTQAPINYSQIIIMPENQTTVGLLKDGKTVVKIVPIATDWPNFLKQASEEGITIPSPIPPVSGM